MTLSEFKAWFEGFTEDMDEAPSKKQWARVKARVKEIDGTVTTYPVFVDRYINPYYPLPRPWFYQSIQSAQCHSANSLHNQYQSALQNFNSAQAMCDLGRAEYKAEAA